jgi:hypothetical protein
MRTWTTDGRLVTRRRYERRLDEVFGSSVGGRVMTWARTAGLVRTGKQGPSYDRPLLPRERAALILTAALVTATNLTYDEATALLLVRQDWIRHAQAVAVTGDDLVLDHAPAPALAVEVTVRNAVLRDPVLGIAAGITLAQEAA